MVCLPNPFGEFISESIPRKRNPPLPNHFPPPSDRIVEVPQREIATAAADKPVLSGLERVLADTSSAKKTDRRCDDAIFRHPLGFPERSRSEQYKDLQDLVIIT